MSITKLHDKRKETESFLKSSLTKEDVSRILGTVTYDRAFYFYEGVGKPNGEFAVSLLDLCNKIKTLSSECLAFHLKRGDFQKWIEEVVGDAELARRVNKIKTRKSVLRNTLYAFVSNRIDELKETWPILLTL